MHVQSYRVENSNSIVWSGDKIRKQEYGMKGKKLQVSVASKIHRVQIMKVFKGTLAFIQIERNWKRLQAGNMVIIFIFQEDYPGCNAEADWKEKSWRHRDN